MGPRLPRSSSDVALESFHKQMQEVEKQVDKLSVLLQNLKEANEESKSVTKASSMKGAILLLFIMPYRFSNVTYRVFVPAIRKRMEKDVDEVGKIARGIKVKIETMNKDNLANRQKPGWGKGTAVDRSRTNMTNALTMKFRDLMTEFQTLRHRIEEEYREVVERRVVTETKIWRVLTNGKALVQVTNAVDHVQSGTTALQNARKLHKGSRKCMCIAIIILLVIGVIIVVMFIIWSNHGKTTGKWCFVFCATARKTLLSINLS
ncbi:hypothetical protein SASPL_153989 [Salvia splendens]|uniref:Syntaxin N-terminal domain-containing protein n=1 Tax=Salvia splendens TaxID=180675 RepID=A0A8X8VZB4_SALSN|nr:hypothetical protein SASPL_153989 [Salvia splendens]